METSLPKYEMTQILCNKVLIIEVVIVYSKKTLIEVNAEKTKCVVMSRVQNTRQNHYIKIINKSFERVENLSYLGTTLTNKILIREDI